MSQPLDLAATQAHTAPPSFKDAWQARLERWYAHPGLYRWSLRNPLTRWLTRRRTRKLFDLMAGFVHEFQQWGIPIDVNFFESVTEALLDLSNKRPDMIVVDMSMPRALQEKTLQALENFNKRGHAPLSVVLITQEKGLTSSIPLGAASSIQLVPGPLSSIWLHAYLTGVVASCKT